MNTEVSDILKSLRNSEASIPEDVIIETSPLNWDLEIARLFWRKRWNANTLSQHLGRMLNSRWLAIDLDDTLLMGSFTTGYEWGELGLAHKSLKYSNLTTDWIRSIKCLMSGKPKRIFCLSTHPFLKNPRVEVAFRPGLLEGLMELKNLGLGLILATASDRSRVAFLMKRFPALNDLFSGERGRVVAAQAITESALIAEAQPELIYDTVSARAHLLRPRSLAVKSPWAISRAADIPLYDLLIDDSTTTASCFHEAGLSKKLLAIEGRHTWSGYGIHILDTALNRLMQLETVSSIASSLRCPADFHQPPAGFPIPPKVEDPLYFPLLHYSDQF